MLEMAIKNVEVGSVRLWSGWGRASGGRVGVGSNGVGSGRLRVELWLGWAGALVVVDPHLRLP